MCAHIRMTKTISLSDEAYDLLKKMKMGKESFSDTIKRLAVKGKLSEVLDLYPEITDKEYEKSVKELRKKIDAKLKDMGL
ncbi:MAG: antitoxin VapB family protein [Methanocellales archaeon]|nr:antitoxin VapB family protein [Methanocellales archaeon]